MSALMISTITVTDPVGFQSYLAKTQKIASAFGAKLLFRGTLAENLNGVTELGPMVVVAEFPDMETLSRWNASPEYKEIVELRDQSSVQVMTAYDSIT